MTAKKATPVPRPQEPAAPRSALDAQLHVLVDTATRQYVIGAAAERAEDAGYRLLRQGEVVRELILTELARRYEEDPTAYRRRVLRGQAILAGASVEREQRPA